MNCFTHPDKTALGFCKSCCRGLCADCAATLPNGLACIHSCETRVTLINRIIDNNEKVIAAANNQVRSSGIFILILGIIISLAGFVPWILSGDTGSLSILAVPGLLFTSYGALRLLKKSERYPSES